MKYMDYREKAEHGTFDFPMEYYSLHPQHPQYEMMYHWHTEYEIIRVVQGTLHLRLDGNELIAQVGQFIIVSDGIVHSGIPSDCLYECIVFDLGSFIGRAKNLSPALKKITEHKCRIHTVMPQAPEELQLLLKKWFSVMNEKQNGYELAAQGCLLQWLSLILQYHLYSSVEDPSHKTTEQLLSLKNVFALIQENYAQKITLSDLAKAAGMSPKYFCSFFFGMTQKTPIDYLNFYRIECACQRLLDTEETITEIAFGCGFNDVSYFTKTFRKYTGNTPLNYRKNRLAAMQNI